MGKSVEEVTRETIEQGGVLAILYFDVHGNSAEVVRNVFVEFLNKLLKENGVVYAVGEIDEIIEDEGLYSTSAEVKILAEDFASLINISVRYSPIGVEILEPHNIKLSIPDAQKIVLNAAQTTHEFYMYIMNHILSKEDMERFKKEILKRAEIGKKILEGAKK